MPRLLGKLCVAAAVVLAAGCSDAGSGDDLSDDEERYAEAVAAGIGDPDDPLTDEETLCLARAWVRTVGAEGIEVSPEELEQEWSQLDPAAVGLGLDGDQGRELRDRVEDDCFDLRQVLRELNRQDGMSDEQVDCLDEGLDDAELTRLLIATVNGAGTPGRPTDPGLADELARLSEECGFDPSASDDAGSGPDAGAGADDTVAAPGGSTPAAGAAGEPAPGGDATRQDLVEALIEAGVPEARANCAGDRFVAEFTQDELNALANAPSAADFPEGTAERVEAILDDCIGNG